ncbi:MAG TPA: hypothetical protein VK879_01830, partial [Candidatus Sulfomarinibacteraceae bacterium]|nr:hypothetical protein [Candidatus Sulfomarinibacteraceae bacterium]
PPRNCASGCWTPTQPGADRKARDGAAALVAKLRANEGDALTQPQPTPFANMSLEEIVDTLRK